MAMTGNLASYIPFVATPQHPKWTYNFNQLTLAGSVVYSYVTLLPLLFWMLLRYYEASKKLVDVLCIYGYTLSVFVPISILCVIPSVLLRWLLILVGGGISAVFLLSNFHAPPPTASRTARATRSARCTSCSARWACSTLCCSSSSRFISFTSLEQRAWRRGH